MSIKENDLILKNGKLTAYVDEENGEVGITFTSETGDIIDLFGANLVSAKETTDAENGSLANRGLSVNDCDMIHIKTFADPTTEDPTGDSYLSIKEMNEITA